MAQTLTPAGKEALDKHFESVAQSGVLPAFIGGATTADGEIYFNAAGKKLVNDASSGDVNPDSLLWVCSMTKFLTHLSALQLIESGKLSEETPVADILPQMANPVLVDETFTRTPKVLGPAKTVLRVKHLLNFSSGLFYRMTPDFGYYQNDEYASVHDAKDPHTSFFNTLKGDLPGVPLKFEPGTDFVYGFSSDVLGFVVEKVSGKTLDEYMKENIFQPLGITASFLLTPELKAKLLPITIRKADSGALETFAGQPGYRLMPQNPTEVFGHFGGVGLYVSLRDYLSLLRHLLQIGAGTAQNPIIKPETYKSLFVPTLSEAGAKSLDVMIAPIWPSGNQWSNALSVATKDWPGRRREGSIAWSGWAGTHFWLDPKAGIAAVFGVQLVCVTAGVGDPHFVKAFDTFEETLYAGLK